MPPKNTPGPYRNWTPEEDAALRTAYLTGASREAMKVLPGRTRAAIHQRAGKIGARLRRTWTPEDDTRLRRLWDSELAIHDIAAKMGATITATLHRAAAIGLPRGCPDGWEYVTGAAERTGFHLRTLRRVLHYSGCTVRTALNGIKHLPVTRWIVAIREVDAAIEAWMQTEPIATAARRLGMNRECLRKRMHRAGVHRVRPVGRPVERARPHWRVSVEDIAVALGVDPEDVRAGRVEARRHDRRPGSPARSTTGGRVADQRGSAATFDPVEFVRTPPASGQAIKGSRPEPVRLGGRAPSTREAA